MKWIILERGTCDHSSLFCQELLHCPLALYQRLFYPQLIRFFSRSLSCSISFPPSIYISPSILFPHSLWSPYLFLSFSFGSIVVQLSLVSLSPYYVSFARFFFPRSRECVSSGETRSITSPVTPPRERAMLFLSFSLFRPVAI